MPQITESQFQDSYQEQDLRFINAMEIIGIMRSIHNDWHNRSFSVEILPNDKLRWKYYLWSEEALKEEAELCFFCDGDGWITAEITWDGDVKFSTSTTITQISDQRAKLNEFVHYVTSLKQP